MCLRVESNILPSEPSNTNIPLFWFKREKKGHLCAYLAIVLPKKISKPLFSHWT